MQLRQWQTQLFVQAQRGLGVSQIQRHHQHAMRLQAHTSRQLVYPASTCQLPRERPWKQHIKQATFTQTHLVVHQQDKPQ